MYLLSSDNMFLFRLFGSTGYCAACKKIIPAFEMVRINDDDNAQRQLRYIEWMGVEIYDFQKVTISTLFKLYNAGLGVLIPKRYHMWG